MTSEICVMNRLGVVLAADSASTVRQTTNDGPKERYFKGANKIFQLSNHHPVGVMIFDSADIMNVPWELVIKSFRAFLGERSFNGLKGYAEELFLYMENNSILFPADVQKIEIIRCAIAHIFQILLLAEKEKMDIIDAILQRTIEVKKLSYPESITDDIISDISEKIRQDIHDQINEFRSDFPENLPEDINPLINLAVQTVIKNPENFLGTTGLVLAGYGEHDAFPSIVEYLVSGVIGGKVLYSIETDDLSVDHHRPAQIKAFAQTSMSDTFIRGLSLELFGSVMKTAEIGLHQLANDILTTAGIDEKNVPNLEDIIESARKNISENVLDAAREQHATPMRKVLGVLPIDEMAELAETLINLQSLKEKVTRPSETVGGPVDVAVITKCEGLVWIKRKHYFSLDINARYVQRLSTAHARN